MLEKREADVIIIGGGIMAAPQPIAWQNAVWMSWCWKRKRSETVVPAGMQAVSASRPVTRRNFPGHVCRAEYLAAA